MFINATPRLRDNPPQLNYGIAVTDIDADGEFELVVAGFGFPNLILKWDGAQFINITNDLLADRRRHAIGIAACDFDGDGREELYILNSDSFSGRKRLADRLFIHSFNGWVDLFALPQNRATLNLTAGRSVAAIDRDGNGQYGFFVANYGGPIRLYELNEDGRLFDAAPEAGLDLSTGGRGVITLPILSAHMDIFAANELGPNYLFRNRGDGTFEECAAERGIDDPDQNARGVAVLDANGDGLLDLVYGNWEGPHRLFVQTAAGGFRDIAPAELAEPSRVRTVIAADFDNDGHQEIFFNNISQPNRLFAFRGGRWTPIDIGDAREPLGLGTGAAIGDFDRDGRLELLIAHGEVGAQPLSLYHVPPNDNHWLRILPLTREGAPARGAVVTLTGERIQKRVIDAGSGYLCQMEPVAHFGLGASTNAHFVEVQWPDGMTHTLTDPAIDTLHTVPYPA